MTKFSDQGYGNLAFTIPGSNACEVVLTITEKGKPKDAVLTHCEKPTLDEPVVKSLLKSSFKPAMLNGKAVAVRAAMRLDYGSTEP